METPPCVFALLVRDFDNYELILFLQCTLCFVVYIWISKYEIMFGLKYVSFKVNKTVSVISADFL